MFLLKSRAGNITLILVFAIILAFSWFKSGNLMGSGESGLPFYDVSIQYEISKESWAYPALGSPTGTVSAAAPTYYVLTQLQRYGIAPVLLQGLFFFIPLLVSGISIYLLTAELFPRLKPQSLLLGVFFYWFNPLSTMIVWNRFLYNYIWFWGFVPLAVFLFSYGIKNKKLHYSFITALSSLIFSYSFTSFVFSVLLALVCLYVTIYFFLINRKSALYYGIYLLLFYIAFATLHAWWISQFFSLVLSSTFQNLVSENFTTSGNVSTLHLLSEKLGRLQDVFRLMPGDFYQTGPTWVHFYGSTIVSFFQYILFGLIIWIIARKRKNKNVLFLALGLGVSIFFMKGAAPPLGYLFELLFKTFSFVQVFRNPVEKFGFLLPVFMAPLVAVIIQKVTSAGSTIFRFMVYTFFVFYFVVLWGGLYATGAVFSSNVRPEGHLEHYQTQVPNYYKIVNNWLISQSGTSRFIQIPIGGEGITYDWRIPYSGVELSSGLFNTPNISFNTTIPFYNALVNQIQKYQVSPELINFMPITHSKYLVVRNDIDYKARRMPSDDIVNRFAKDSVNNKLLNQVFSAGELSIYEVSQDYQWPKLFMTNSLVSSNAQDLPSIIEEIGQYPQKKIGIVSQNVKTIDELESIQILEPESSFHYNSQNYWENFSDEDLLTRLFYVRHLPSDPLYPLLRIKEKIETPSSDDLEGWLIHNVGILGKRAVEVYKLRQLGESEDLITQAEDRYARQLQFLEPHLEQYGTHLPDLLKQLLFYQYALVIRSRSTIYENIHETLKRLNLLPHYQLPSGQDLQVYQFKIHKPDEYKLTQVNNLNNFFLDGQLIEKQSIFFLSEGIHEIAIPTSLEKEILFMHNHKTITNSELLEELNLGTTPSSYKIAFDYRFISGTKFELRLQQDIEAQSEPVYSRVINQGSTNDWRHYTDTIITSPGATNIKLLAQEAKSQYCNKFLWVTNCSSGNEKYVIELRNFTITQLKSNPPHLVSTKPVSFQPPAEVEMLSSSPTNYKIRVAKNNENPEVLVLSELYSSGWQIKDSEGKNKNLPHMLVNLFANGWVITERGEYILNISFEPQKWLQVGKIVSIISSLLICVFSLCFILWQRKIQKLLD